MLKFLRACIRLLLALCVLILILQIFINRNLSSWLRLRILPPLSDAMGQSIRLDTAKVNLFTLAGHVNKAAIGYGTNSDFFIAADTMAASLGWPDWRQRVQNIRHLKMDGVELFLAQTKKSPAAVVPATTAGGEGTETASPGAPGIAMPVRIQQADAAVRLHYRNTTLKGNPLTLDMALKLDAQNIATIPAKEWGTFTLTGTQDGNPLALITRFEGRIAPLANPQQLDFDLQGGVQAIDPKTILPLMGKLELTADSLALDVTLTCRQGAFDHQKSALVLHFIKPCTTGRLAQKTKGLKLPPELRITVPVSGTLADPKFDVAAGTTHAVLGLLTQNTDWIIQNLKKAGKDKGTRKALQSLGTLLLNATPKE